jgi:hypothetical protein
VSDLAFPILGRPFRARGLTPALARWVEARWRFPEHAPAPHLHRIDLRLVERSGVGTAWEGGEGWRPRGAGWETGGRRAGVRTLHAPSRSRLLAWGAAEGDPPPELLQALFLAIGHALWASGLVALHAAVIVRGGKATALLGRSGAGKSTTLLQAVQAGWTPLAEDMSWLDPRTLRLYGWDRGVRVWPETLARLAPGLAGAPWEADAQGKLVLPLQRLGAEGPGVGVLERIALLERDAERPSGWEPLPGADAVRALWESVGVPLSPADRPVLSGWIASVISRVETRRLRLGTTPLPLQP